MRKGIPTHDPSVQRLYVPSTARSSCLRRNLQTIFCFVSLLNGANCLPQPPASQFALLRTNPSFLNAHSSYSCVNIAARAAMLLQLQTSARNMCHYITLALLTATRGNDIWKFHKNFISTRYVRQI
jgi:hypothetical protein